MRREEHAQDGSGGQPAENTDAYHISLVHCHLLFLLKKPITVSRAFDTACTVTATWTSGSDISVLAKLASMETLSVFGRAGEVPDELVYRPCQETQEEQENDGDAPFDHDYQVSNPGNIHCVPPFSDGTTGFYDGGGYEVIKYSSK
jgi:hypothetical protein